MNQWTELKKGDRIVFRAKNGKGSVVKVKNKGHYFMPAKLGMRLRGEKSPIGKFENFVVSDLAYKEFEGKYIMYACLSRCSDSIQFIVNYPDLQRYFAKTNISSLGGI